MAQRRGGEPRVRVVLELDDDQDDGREELWALPLGDGRYRLENTPLFAYGVSHCDVVEAVPAEEGGPLVVRSLVEKAGHRTVRLLFEEELDLSRRLPSLLDRLSEIGCSWEGFERRFVAVDVPPAIDFERVIELLTSSDVEWEHADPTHEEMSAI